jgi:large subunit ribosomal protein L6
MSRIGNKPIPVPDGVKITINDRKIDVEGPKGKLSFTHHELIEVALEDDGKTVMVRRPNDEREARSLHGLTRSLVANMVEGVTKGYEKKLELYGVGFSVTLQGDKLSFVCGYANTVVKQVPAGLEVEVTTAQARGDNDPARFAIRGCDKQRVGEFAAQCRRVRKPEPYKGKGFRYAGERIVRKVGKAFAGAGS